MIPKKKRRFLLPVLLLFAFVLAAGGYYYVRVEERAEEIDYSGRIPDLTGHRFR